MTTEPTTDDFGRQPVGVPASDLSIDEAAVWHCDVPGYRLAELEAKVERANRRADKLGLAPLSMKRLETRLEPMPGNSDAFYDVITVELSGRMPYLRGWRMGAKIEPTSVQGSNIVWPIPYSDIVIPTEFRSCEPECDHCRTNRARNFVYGLYRPETQEWMRVGRTCLDDFFGQSAEAMLAAFEIGQDLSTCSDGAEDWDDCELPELHSRVAAFPTKRVLAVALSLVQTFGFRKRSDDSPSTGDQMINVLIPPKSAAGYEFAKKHRGEELEQKAEQLLGWSRSAAAANDFEHNVHAALAEDFQPPRRFQLIGAGLALFERHLANQLKAASSSNEYVGQIGQRADFELLVLRVRRLDTEFGISAIVHMEDTAGHCFQWKASDSKSDLSAGMRLRVKGTIKKHIEYQGVKQTYLTRCKYEVLLPEAAEQSRPPQRRPRKVSLRA